MNLAWSRWADDRDLDRVEVVEAVHGRRSADTVALEDSPAGVAAGLAAGATVVGVSERALATAATVVVRDLRGLTRTGAHLRIPGSALLRGDGVQPPVARR